MKNHFIRGYFHWLLCLWAPASCLAGPTNQLDKADPDGLIPVNNHWQLFLDDYVVARETGIDRVVHHPNPMGLVIPADKPWETFGCSPQLVVRRDDGTFFCLYHAFWWDTTPEAIIPRDRAHDFVDSLAYATSKDGVHWEKPALGLTEAPAEIDWQKFPPFPSPKGSSKENNLIVKSGNPLMQSGFGLWDLGQYGYVSDPAKRYAIFYKDQGYFASEFPDFLHDPGWTNKLTPCGGTFSPRGKGVHYWDNLHEEWATIAQNAVPHWFPGREVARFGSKDLIHWHSEIVLAADSADPHIPQAYEEPMTMLPFCADGVVFGLLSWFHSDRTVLDGGPVWAKTPEHPYIWPWARKGLCEMRIAVSRDGGETWDRTSSREAWIPYGREDESYDRLVLFPLPPVIVGDEDWFYMDVINGNHLVIRNSKDQMPYYHNRVVKHQIALYTQKHNRYVSLRAGNQKTILITKPIRLDGMKLQLNVEANHGLVRVAVASGKPVSTLRDTTLSMAPHLAEDHQIKGFTFEDCAPIQDNNVQETVQFKNGGTLSDLKDQPVRLLFEITDADLYGFRIVP